MITFGRFGPNKDKEKDKGYFLESLNSILVEHTYIYNPQAQTKDLSEKEINTALKKIFKKEENYSCNSTNGMYLTFLLERMGLSYYILTKKEKEEIAHLDFTYDSWKKKISELFENFIERSKEVCPPEVWFCFDDICFIVYVQIIQQSEFKTNNFLVFIRDYFILNRNTEFLKEYRDEKKFKEIQRKVLDIYPVIREKYGSMWYKFINYVRGDSDYDYEITRNMLNNYYNKNNNIEDDEKINLKDKID